MAEKDMTQKMLLEYPDVFADIFNALVFEGSSVLEPDKLVQVPSENISIPDGVRAKQLFRDVLMEHRENGSRYLILAVENQSAVDYTMPLRGMGMDYATYEQQLRKEGTHELVPVITLVLYYGTERWTGPRCLYDMLKLPDKDKYPGVERYVHDYGMNLVELRALSEAEYCSLRSDFKYLAGYLCHGTQPALLRQEYEQKLVGMRHMEETTRALAALSKDNRFLEVGRYTDEENSEKGQGKNMCTFLNYVEEVGIEKGRTEGESRVIRGMISTCRKLGASWQDTLQNIKEECVVSEADAERYMKLYWS